MNTNQPTVVTPGGFLPSLMKLGCIASLVGLLTGCVINTNVAVTKDSVVVQNNISVSERILRLLIWF